MINASEAAIPFSELNAQAKSLLSQLASYQDPKQADFYPFLALMVLGMSEEELADESMPNHDLQIPHEDLIAIGGELLRLAFNQKQNFKDALQRPHLFCVALMATLLRSEGAPFDFEKREALSIIKLLDGNARIEKLKAAFKGSKEFLAKLLAPLCFALLRAPNLDGKKPAPELTYQAFIKQILELIKFRLNLILSEDYFDKTLCGYIKAELNYLRDHEDYFSFLEEELETAIQINLPKVKPSSLVKLQQIHDKWTLMIKNELMPLYDRVEELTAFCAYMAQKFPKSPIRKDFDTLGLNIRARYNDLLATLGDFDLTLGYIREKITATNQAISELIEPEKNRAIGGQTPLHRLAKEIPKKEEDAKHIKMLMTRLKKEGADSKVTTRYYVRKFPTLIYDVLSRFPWVRGMANAYSTNPERDARGISQTDLLNQALQDKPEERSFSFIDTMKGIFHLKSNQAKEKDMALPEGPRHSPAARLS